MRFIFFVVFWFSIVSGLGTFFLSTEAGSRILGKFFSYIQVKKTDDGSGDPVKRKMTAHERIAELNRISEDHMEAMRDKINLRKDLAGSEANVTENFDNLMEKFKSDLESYKLTAYLQPQGPDVGSTWQDLDQMKVDVRKFMAEGSEDQARLMVDKARQMDSRLRDVAGSSYVGHTAELDRIDKLRERNEKLRQDVARQEEKVRDLSEKLRDKARENAEKARAQIDRSNQKIQDARDRMEHQKDVLQDRMIAQQDRLRSQMDRLNQR